MSPKDRLEKVLRKHYGSDASEVVDAIVLYVGSVMNANVPQVLPDVTRPGTADSDVNALHQGGGGLAIGTQEPTK